MKRIPTLGFVAILLGCFGTETENPEIIPNLSGRFVDTSGHPVAGAVVKAVRIGTTVETDSAQTDSLGKFGFRNLPPDSYNLLGNYRNSTLAALITGVELTRIDSVKDIGTDTMRTPGQILGQVLYNGQPRANIPCYLWGTLYNATSDSAGYVLITGIPQGIYDFVYYAQSYGYQNSHDNGVSVLSGQITVLPPKTLDTLGPAP